jgi:hypothetical protein
MYQDRGNSKFYSRFVRPGVILPAHSELVDTIFVSQDGRKSKPIRICIMEACVETKQKSLLENDWN